RRTDDVHPGFPRVLAVEPRVLVEIIIGQHASLLHAGAVEVLGEVRCVAGKVDGSHKRDQGSKRENGNNPKRADSSTLARRLSNLIGLIRKLNAPISAPF